MALPASSEDRGAYTISVAAELGGMGAQNLRLYEARGLLQPDQTHGGSRRYSVRDLARLRRISDLLDAGSTSRIDMVLDLEAQNSELRAGTGGEAMADQGIDLSQDIPEADLLEQRAPLDPNEVIDAEQEPVAVLPGHSVDEADRLEQEAALIYEADDDYPHDRP